MVEVEAGNARLHRIGAGSRADNLREWFKRVVDRHAERILPFDIAAARIAGPRGDAALAVGHPGSARVALAAIAEARELIVATSNRRHFEPLGVSIVNPFLAQ